MLFSFCIISIWMIYNWIKHFIFCLFLLFWTTLFFTNKTLCLSNLSSYLLKIIIIISISITSIHWLIHLIIFTGIILFFWINRLEYLLSLRKLIIYWFLFNIILIILQLLIHNYQLIKFFFFNKQNLLIPLYQMLIPINLNQFHRHLIKAKIKWNI